MGRNSGSVNCTAPTATGLQEIFTFYPQYMSEENLTIKFPPPHTHTHPHHQKNKKKTTTKKILVEFANMSVDLDFIWNFAEVIFVPLFWCLMIKIKQRNFYPQSLSYLKHEISGKFLSS